MQFLEYHERSASVEIERALAPFHDGLFPLYTEGGLRSAKNAWCQ
jgi:hypothetical protein